MPSAGGALKTQPVALKELLDKEWNWMRVLYTTEATAHGGRDGHVRSSDGILDLDPAGARGNGWAG